jgi:hypothetical protein
MLSFFRIEKLVLFASLSCNAASAWSLDSDTARRIFGDGSAEVPLAACEAQLGSGPNLYPPLDIQKRFATWVSSISLLLGHSAR